MSAVARLAVITVVRDAAGSLEETIRSVLEQKERTDLDYLIIDGGSTDGSVEIIRSYADRLFYWVSEPDHGIYDAMNKGWDAARSDSLILFLGAGDRLLSLPDDIASLCRDPRDVLYGDVLMGEQRLFKGGAGLRLRLYNTLHHQALLVNKGNHPDPPFDTHFRVYADFDFNQRLLKGGARFLYCPGLLAFAHPGGVSDRQDFAESLRVIGHNFGIGWVLLARLGKAALRLFPFLNRLRPFREV